MTEFLDKVKDGFDKGVTVVSVRSKEMLEAAKIKTRIGSLANQKKDALEELGSLVYAMRQQGGLDLGQEAADKCAEIADFAKQIEAKEEELRQVHLEAKKNLGIPVCSCGVELAEDDKFCSKCGKAI